MPRPKGNPNWGKSAAVPDAPTQFQQLVDQLQIPERDWPTHPAVRKFCAVNVNRSYIPEWLIKQLNLIPME